MSPVIASLLVAVLYFTSIANAEDAIGTEGETLLLESVFRHGDRVPTPPERTIPNDPNNGLSLDPPGPGQLTNKGKERAYTHGLKLRELFGDFLGKYDHRAIEAMSTDVDRTKMTLQLVLAGAYPPTDENIWNDDLGKKWQPIPTDYDTHSDLMLHPMSCPLFKKEFARVRNDIPESHSLKESFGPLEEKLTNITGKNMDHLAAVFQYYHLIEAYESLELPLPPGTEKLLPEISRATEAVYEFQSWTPRAKQLNGGRLLSKMIHDMELKADGNLHPHGRKWYLYSSHETNIAAAVGVYGGKIEPPQYTSGVTLRLLKKGGHHYVETLHYLGIPPKFERITVPGCEPLCELAKYKKLLADALPDKSELKC